jgi:hypothetical protein
MEETSAAGFHFHVLVSKPLERRKEQLRLRNQPRKRYALAARHRASPQSIDLFAHRRYVRKLRRKKLLANQRSLQERKISASPIQQGLSFMHESPRGKEGFVGKTCWMRRSLSARRWPSVGLSLKTLARLPVAH